MGEYCSNCGLTKKQHEIVDNANFPDVIEVCEGFVEHSPLTKEQMVERINALEEEFFLSLNRQFNEEHKASQEANRLKMLILKELELI